jgi:hypothetical protein
MLRCFTYRGPGWQTEKQTMEQPSEEDHERGYSRENGSVPDGVLMSYDDSSHETYGDGS